MLQKCPVELAGDLPIFQEGSPTCLFDVALYTNPSSKSGIPTNANISAHFDPGLLAVSWYSSTSGLQVYSFVQRKWFDVPVGMGVVWAGRYLQKKGSSDSGSFGFMQAYRYGVHRVLFAEEPRLTFWSEVCTSKQLDFGNQKFSGLRLDLDADLSGATQNQPSLHLERLLGVPSIKSGSVQAGKCAYCGFRGQHRNPYALARKQPVLSVKCAQCKQGYRVVGMTKEDARYKLLDALYCDERCAASDFERHALECNQQHLRYAYVERK